MLWHGDSSTSVRLAVVASGGGDVAEVNGDVVAEEIPAPPLAPKGSRFLVLPSALYSSGVTKSINALPLRLVSAVRGADFAPSILGSKEPTNREDALRGVCSNRFPRVKGRGFWTSLFLRLGMAARRACGKPKTLAVSCDR